MTQQAVDLSPEQGLLRKKIIARFAGIFEREVRARHYAHGVNELVRSTHREVMQLLQKSFVDLQASQLNSDEKNIIGQSLVGAIERFDRLDSTLELLLDGRLRNSHSNLLDLHRAMRESNRAALDLSQTLVEKALFERHMQMLESIVLSHENVTYWQQHINAILSDYHALIPGEAFYVAFSEKGSYSVSLFHMRASSVETRRLVRQELIKNLNDLHGFRVDTSGDFHEYVIDNAEPWHADESVGAISLECVSAKVPEINGTGIHGSLGIIRNASKSLSMQQKSLLRSVLSVMVMVVGSSRALGKTLLELEYRSSHDPLTGLHNRRYFEDVLQVEQSRAQRHSREFSVLMIDLDDFKDINDTYGHPCGDEVLVCVADVIRQSMRVGDASARIGGDEFSALLNDTSGAGALIVAEKLRTNIRERTFSCPHGGEFHVTVSIGVITYPDDAQTIADLIAGADHSLYRAKRLGKDSVISLASVKDVLQTSRLSRGYAETLRNSLRENRVQAHYQPIFNCASGDLYAYEALARIREHNGNLIAAGAFIEAAEKYGISREVDRVIMRSSLEDLARHTTGLPSAFKLFINLSPQEIHGMGSLRYAEVQCHELGVPPDRVVFEITERDAISDMANMRKFLKELREKGFLFALDDFGSGYNSFHYLRELTFDYVKIDGSFVRNILHSQVDKALVSNLSRLCQDLGIKTIAEFVESADVMGVLCDVGVDYAQGYYLGKPAPDFGV